VKKATIYIDGHYLKVPPQWLEAFTPGVFQGDGVFETLLAVGGKVFDVSAHLKRLNGACKGAKMSSMVVNQVVNANKLDIARVRILAWKEGKQTHTVAMALPYTYPTKELTVCLLKTNRPATSKFAHQKSLDYSLFADAYRKANAQGFDDVLLINRSGYIVEASRANVFIVTDNQWMTPPLSSGCLNGITRQQLMTIARRMGQPVREKNITPAMVRDANEVFLTNSLLGIKPVKFSLSFLPR
jgi:branched-chain amino acid aminotransferase